MEYKYRASVIIVNYNGKNDLDESLKSAQRQTLNRDSYEIIVVDNASSDGSKEFIRDNFPDVKLVENEKNRWYCGGNNDGMNQASGEYIVILNPDVEVDQNWLEELIHALESTPESVGLATSKIIKYNNRNEMNTAGTWAHFTGLGFSRGKNMSVDNYTESEFVPGVSGCSFALTRDVYETIGGFDEMLEFYNDDIDYSWTSALAGYRILFVPESVVYHKSSRPLPPWRFFNYQKNRLITLYKHLKTSSIFLMAPQLLVTEIGVLIGSLFLGRSYTLKVVDSWRWMWGNRKAISARKESTQSARDVSDSKLINQFKKTIPFNQFGFPNLLHILLNALLIGIFTPAYWAIQIRDRISASIRL